MRRSTYSLFLIHFENLIIKIFFSMSSSFHSHSHQSILLFFFWTQFIIIYIFISESLLSLLRIDFEFHRGSSSFLVLIFIICTLSDFELLLVLLLFEPLFLLNFFVLFFCYNLAFFVELTSF